MTTNTDELDYYVRESLDAQRQATTCDQFLAGVLGQWLAERPADYDLINMTADRVAAALYDSSTLRRGFVFDLRRFYATIEAEAGRSLDEYDDIEL